MVSPQGANITRAPTSTPVAGMRRAITWTAWPHWGSEACPASAAHQLVAARPERRRVRYHPVVCQFPRSWTRLDQGH